MIMALQSSNMSVGDEQHGHVARCIGWRSLLKFLGDRLIAGIALVLLSPLLFLIALLVRWKMGGPVLFRQRRPGYQGKPFVMIKFRTMCDACDPTGRLLPDEERMTPLGSWLRSTSLDELPELINVVRGEMSLVGPRPLMMEYLERYSEEQARRHDVKPGITGWAQINGRNAIDWDEKFALDVWYVENWSLSLDLTILLRTLKTVAFREGISYQGCATTTEFMGGPADERLHSERR